MEQSILLLAESSKGWSVVAVLEDLYNPGAFGISEDWELGPVTVDDLGGKRILKVMSHKTRGDTDMGINEAEGVDTTTLTVCVLGQGGSLTRCPLQVPLHDLYVRDVLRRDLDPEEKAQIAANVKELGTRNLPIRKETEVKVELAPDGTATVTLIKGDASGLKEKLGPKKLW